MATTTFLMLLLGAAIALYIFVWLLGFTIWHTASYLMEWDNLYDQDSDQ